MSVPGPSCRVSKTLGTTILLLSLASVFVPSPVHASVAGDVAQFRYEQAFRQGEQTYAEIQRMDPYMELADLARMLSKSKLSKEKQQHIWWLNYYFELIDGIVNAMVRGNIEYLASDYIRMAITNIPNAKRLNPIDLDNMRTLALWKSLRQSKASDRQVAKQIEQFVRRLGYRNTETFVNRLQATAGPNTGKVLESMRQVRLQTILAETGFQVYSNVGYENTPDLSRFGVSSRVKLLTLHHFFAYDGQEYALEDIDAVQVTKSVLLLDPNMIYVADIEHFPLRGDRKTVDESLEKLCRALDLVHKVNPNILVGLYRILPRREVWLPMFNHQSLEGAARLQEWLGHNAYISHVLGPRVDAVFPSLYTFYPSMSDWAQYAEANIREAEKIGKPVIPYLWPQYHPNGGRNPLGNTFLNERYFAHQLKVLHGLGNDRVAGVVLWGAGEPWDPRWERTSSWWTATRSFIRQLP